MEVRNLSVPEAGKRWFNSGPAKSYDLVKTGFIPAIKIGGRLVVPEAAMERRYQELVDQAGKQAAAAGAGRAA